MGEARAGFLANHDYPTHHMILEHLSDKPDTYKVYSAQKPRRLRDHLRPLLRRGKGRGCRQKHLRAERLLGASTLLPSY